MKDYREVVMEAATDGGFFSKETRRSLILICPLCNKPKLYFDKTVGNFICFAGDCGNKGSVLKLYVQLTGKSYKEAKSLIFDEKVDHSEHELRLFLEEKVPERAPQDLPIPKPDHFFPIRHAKSVRGRAYVLSRGISTEIAEKYKIEYSPIMDRIVFSVYDTKTGDLLGYQARAVEAVPKSDRMRNSPDFHKGNFLLFSEHCKDSKHLIVAEGPVDAIKFDLCGGNVATMGKSLTPRQIKLINDHPCEKVYWALDEDALSDVMEYSSMIEKPSFIIMLPEHARQRILSSGKEKADFGECTPQECLEAFSSAESLCGKLFLQLK